MEQKEHICLQQVLEWMYNFCMQLIHNIPEQRAATTQHDREGTDCSSVKTRHPNSRHLNPGCEETDTYKHISTGAAHNESFLLIIHTFGQFHSKCWNNSVFVRADLAHRKNSDTQN